VLERIDSEVVELVAVTGVLPVCPALRANGREGQALEQEVAAPPLGGIANVGED